VFYNHGDEEPRLPLAVSWINRELKRLPCIEQPL